MIICLETATDICSVALVSEKNGVVAVKESDEPKSHGSLLTLFIDDIMKENGITSRDLKAVAVSKGPGSYTGLRIGVSVAKGMAYAASIPLIGIETTTAMFWGLYEKTNNRISNDGDKILYCPMIDARRMEVYYAVYDSRGNKIEDITAGIIDHESFGNYPDSYTIVFFGNGCRKCKKVISRTNLFFMDDYVISAADMYKPSVNAFMNNIFEDVAYFEPFYLKDFIATKPGKNILGK